VGRPGEYQTDPLQPLLGMGKSLTVLCFQGPGNGGYWKLKAVAKGFHQDPLLVIFANVVTEVIVF